MIGHAIPFVQLLPSNFGFSLDGALGEGFGPGPRLLSSCSAHACGDHDKVGRQITEAYLRELPG